MMGPVMDTHNKKKIGVWELMTRGELLRLLSSWRKMKGVFGED